MSTNPLDPNPTTDLDGPGVYPPFEPIEHIAAEHFPETDSEPDYNEPANGVDDEPEDEEPEEDLDEEPLAEPA